MRNALEKLVNRLQRIGITIELEANYPWIYMRKVNGKFVRETYLAEHGFTIALWVKHPIQLTDTKQTFKVIRKYL